jgi:chain length determinant protein EpsF
LRARFRLFATALTITVATALVLTLLMAPTYRATTALVVDARLEQSLSTAFEVFSAPTERLAYLQTQIDIITSPTVARRVVERMDLASDPETIEAYARTDAKSGSIEDWIADGLLRNLDVETTQSSVVHLRYESDEASAAAETANAFAEAYMEATLELQVEPTRQAADWFDQQLTTLRADLENAQAQMTAFQQQHGIVSIDEGLDDKYARFQDLSAQLLRAQEQAIESGVLAAYGARAIENGSTADDLPEVRENAYVRELDAAIVEGEARLGALAADLGRNHPAYRQQLAENAARREQRAAEASKVVASAGLVAEQSRARMAEIERLLGSQRAELLELKSSRDALSVLKRNVDTAQNAYDTAMQRYVVNQVESRASQANVAMLSPAAVPASPHKPKLLLNLVLATGIGSLLGGGLVALAELTDRRIRSTADLRGIATMPILGELTSWSPSKPALLPRLASDDDRR